jgi:hypothetical protein
MAEYVTDAADGTWFWYRQEPAELAVHAGTSPEAGISVVWKGRIGIDALFEFFEKAVAHISEPNARHFRSWVVTQEGPRSFGPTVERVASVPQDVLERADYVRLECLSATPRSDSDEGQPIFTAFASVDRTLANLETTQETVGVHLQGPEDLRTLTDDITDAVVSTHSRFFRAYHGYNREAVRRDLVAARSDVRTAWSQGPQP